MRAISLSLRAFGPYLENQTIQFEMLGQETIFLVTGPTGAGKTTIFDAICYALYGRASGSDREQDSLRSHFAAREDKTEVRFRFALQDKEYEVIRNPRQQKEKERGEGFTDEPAKAVLYEIIHGEPKLISARIKDVNDALEEKLGFDYDQFRKMILIPQGEFRKLISENSKEREAILQKIFRTYLYEKITEELKNEAKELKEQIAGITAMMEQELYRLDWQHALPAEDDDIKAALEKLTFEISQTGLAVQTETDKKEKLAKGQKDALERLHTGRILEEKFTELERLLHEQEELNANSGTFEEKRRRLTLARNADKIVPLESQSKTRKKEWEEHEQQFNQQEQRLRDLESEFLQISQAYQVEQEREPERDAMKEEIKKAKEQLVQVSNYLLLKKETDQVLKKKELLLKERDQLTIDMKSQQSLLDSVERQLEKETSLTAAFYDSKSELDKAMKDLSKLREIEIENKKLIQFRKKYVETQKAFRQVQEEATELGGRLEALEQEQQLQYAAILAHSLNDGSPCPVCGSMEHPQKQMHKDSLTQTEDLAKLKELVKRKNDQVAELQREFYECKSNGQSQRTIVENMRREILDLLPEEALTAEAIAAAVARTLEKEQTLVSRHRNAEQELKEIQELKSQKTKIKTRIEEFKQTFDQLSDKYQSASDSAAGALVRLKDMEQQLPGNPDDASAFKEKITQMEGRYKQLVQNWEKTVKTYQSAQEQVQKAKVILEQMHGYRQKAEETYSLHQRKYEEAISANGFRSEAGYQEAKLSPQEQQQVEQEIVSFENRLQQISYRLKELQAAIAGKERPDITKLTSASEEIQQELQRISDLLYSLTQKQEHDILVSKRVGELLAKQKEMEGEYYIIGELADLAHGNNQLKLSFERYVLSSFLDEILIQANLRLERMTNHRYQLIRSGQIAKRGAQSGLDLEVLDHHTGKQRSVKTLSGGEGFKASLSLALGLADVVQAHAGGVQLDTLFIDEGFGTLDEISLQQAIDCLKDLQDSNRLLGIISHVPQLKNEIHAKLQIIPSPKGSRLEFSFS